MQRKTSSSPSGAPPAAPHGVAAVAFWLRCEAPTSIHQETHYPQRDTRIASVALQADLAAALALEPTLSTLWFYPPFTIALKVPPRRRNQGDPTEGNSDPSPYLWMLPKPQRRSAVLSSSSLLPLLSANRVYSDKGKLGALVPSSGQGLAFRQTCDYPWVGTTGASVKLG